MRMPKTATCWFDHPNLLCQLALGNDLLTQPFYTPPNPIHILNFFKH